jgi:hypothetical protein
VTDDDAGVPARFDELMEALRNEPEGDALASRLESWYGHMGPFELRSAGGDPWVLVRTLVKFLAEDPGMCTAMFRDGRDGFLTGFLMGRGLAFQDAVVGPFRAALDGHGDGSSEDPVDK